MGHTPETRKADMAKRRLRRAAWLLANGPCRACGSIVDLEVDHVDPSLKVSHSVWSWETSKMLAELSKCQALCGDCHMAKTIVQMKERVAEVGKPNLAQRKLDRPEIQQILAFVATGLSERRIARLLGTKRHSINDMLREKTYRDWTKAFPVKFTESEADAKPPTC